MTQPLPPEVQGILARSVGAFLRSAPNQQLPARLRRFRGMRPKGLAPHRAELVGVLDDEVLRRQILDWLDRRPPIPHPDAELLRVAVERKEGWAEALGAGSKQRTGSDDKELARLGAAIERERERTRRAKAEATRAKEEARRAKEEARRTVTGERTRAAELSKEVARLGAELTAAIRAAKEAKAEAVRAHRARERAERKARNATAKAQAERDASARQLRAARRDASAALARAERLEAERRAAGGPRTKKKKPAPARPKPPARRAPLPVPKGRLEDDPETLLEWLRAPGVVLLVDGYNVTKAEGGFGELSLELQRDRLVEAVNALQLKTGARATIVFDGSTMPPGVARPRKRRVTVEYSTQDETADDHIVALLEKLAPDPVVLATNDRELQGRARALGATVATSGQLLALLR